MVVTPAGTTQVCELPVYVNWTAVRDTADSVDVPAIVTEPV